MPEKNGSHGTLADETTTLSSDDTSMPQEDGTLADGDETTVLSSDETSAPPSNDTSEAETVSNDSLEASTSTADSAAQSGDDASKSTGCSCTDFINSHGYGQCKKSEPSILGGSMFCYVDFPSSCTDLLESGTNPGVWYSAQPCQIKSDLDEMLNNWKKKFHIILGFFIVFMVLFLVIIGVLIYKIKQNKTDSALLQGEK